MSIAVNNATNYEDYCPVHFQLVLAQVAWMRNVQDSVEQHSKHYNNDSYGASYHTLHKDEISAARFITTHIYYYVWCTRTL